MGTGMGLTETLMQRAEILQEEAETTFSRLTFEEKLDRLAKVRRC